MVSLRKMTSTEFAVFTEYSIRDYAKDLMVNHGIAPAAASEQAQKEFSDMLPLGTDTPGNSLMVIDAASRPVGVIWYLFENTDSVHHAFLCDFIVTPDERRKGYASAALSEMERDATAHGCTESRLYVCGSNHSALNLYTRCGYSIFRQADGGVYMKKELK